MARTLIKNGTVVHASGRVVNDVLVDGETIVAVGAPGWFEAAEEGADKVIDASGKYVIAGGIDVHTHMELPFGGTFASDTFETGTIAAAWGGVTTIIDMAVQRTGENVLDGLADWHSKAEGQCAIDYAFHQIVGGVDEEALKAIRYLTETEGVTSFKLFMAYPGVFYSDDGAILRAMQVAGECGATIMMHAENGIAIDVLVGQALARGETDPKYHSLTRPVPARGRGHQPGHRAVEGRRERAALRRAHVGQRGPRRGGRGPPRGPQRVRRDLPQYLYMTLEDHLARPGFEGAKYVASPPIRSSTTTAITTPTSGRACA